MAVPCLGGATLCSVLIFFSFEYFLSVAAWQGGLGHISHYLWKWPPALLPAMVERFLSAVRKSQEIALSSLLRPAAKSGAAQLSGA